MKNHTPNGKANVLIFCPTVGSLYLGLLEKINKDPDLKHKVRVKTKLDELKNDGHNIGLIIDPTTAEHVGGNDKYPLKSEAIKHLKELGIVNRSFTIRRLPHKQGLIIGGIMDITADFLSAV